MAIEMLKTVAGIEMQAVTYKGSPPVIGDLVNESLTMSVLSSVAPDCTVKTETSGGLTDAGGGALLQAPSTSSDTQTRPIEVGRTARDIMEVASARINTQNG